MTKSKTKTKANENTNANTNANTNKDTNTDTDTKANNKSLSDVDSYKQFSEYALVIYKFMVGLMDKYGIMTVDWMGYVLGLNKNGKPISKQSAEELTENLKQFSEELKKPEVRESILLIIKESEPVLKEALYSMLNVAMSAGEFVLKDGITFICSDTPAAPICGLFKFAENTVDFGQDLLDGTKSGVHTIKSGEAAIENVSNELEKNKQLAENMTNISNNVKNETTKAIKNVSNQVEEGTKLATNMANNVKNETTKAIKNVSNQVEEGTKLATNMANNVKNEINNQLEEGKKLAKKTSSLSPDPDSIQKGGAKELKKYSKEKKIIETRVNKSINEFFNLKSNMKTRRHRKK